MIRALPELFPQADTFCFPYTSVIAEFKVEEEFRLRFCRNLDRLVLSEDAWTFSTSKQFIRSEAAKSLAHPKRLISYIGRGIDYTFSSYLNNKRSVAVHLPKPIFRYTTLFKENFIERCKGHVKRLGLTGFSDIPKLVEKEEGESFFETAARLQREATRMNYPAEIGTIQIEEQPRIMQELIKKRTTTKHYYIRETILDLIAKA